VEVRDHDAVVLAARAALVTPSEVVDRLGRWRERTGVSRVYLEALDLFDLDHVELVAAEVFPWL
jgi:alkanesulfonate monooxygenase